MDIESKKFLGQPKNFVSIFNALLFDGQPVLKPEYLKDENSELVMNVSLVSMWISSNGMRMVHIWICS